MDLMWIVLLDLSPKVSNSFMMSSTWIDREAIELTESASLGSPPSSSISFCLSAADLSFSASYRMTSACEYEASLFCLRVLTFDTLAFCSLFFSFLTSLALFRASMRFACSSASRSFYSLFYFDVLRPCFGMVIVNDALDSRDSLSLAFAFL